MEATNIDAMICRQWIVSGKIRQAKQWLATQEQTAEILLLTAMCQKEGQLAYWERAIEALRQQPPSEDLILSLGQAIKYSRMGCDQKRQLQYLHEIIHVSKELKEPLQLLHWKAILANLYLQIGQIEKAQPLLQESVQESIASKQRLLLISQGILLSSLWMQTGQFEKAAALSLLIEQAAIERSNWLAFATARNIRASCWMIRKQEKQSVHLLLDSGDFLVSKGAVAALNLIKARLRELQLLLGRERLYSIIQERK